MPTWLFVVLYVIPLVALWAALLIDLVRRRDLSVGRKLAWSAMTLVTAEFGAALYIAFRPLRYPEEGLTPGTQNQDVAQMLQAAESGEHTSLVAAKETVLRSLD